VAGAPKQQQQDFKRLRLQPDRATTGAQLSRPDVQHETIEAMNTRDWADLKVRTTFCKLERGLDLSETSV